MRVARSLSRLATQQHRIAVAPSSLSSNLFHSSAVVQEKKLSTQWTDPKQRQYKFWNRETSQKGTYSYILEISPESIQREAKVISLADPNTPADEPLHKGKLPLSTTLLGVGTKLADFDHLRNEKPNVLFMSPSCPKAASVLPLVLAAFPSIEWVHCRSAGIDFVESDELQDICKQRDIQITNAKVNLCPRHYYKQTSIPNVLAATENHVLTIFFFS